MKRISFILFVFVFSVASIYGQPLQMSESKYYRVYTDTGKDTAEKVASIMDSYLMLFNKYLHFDIDSLPSKMRIRLFGNKTDFDNYLNSIISRTSNSYVLLQYKDPAANELIAYVLSDQDRMRKDLIHYGLIQFFKAYISYPPLWLMNGFAVYFENTGYNLEDLTVTYRENYEWIPTLKKAVNDGKTIPIDKLLMLDLSDANNDINTFYAQSWGLVDFLLNSAYLDYNRLLWDSLSSLKKSASQKENETNAISKAFKWIDKEIFVADFVKYVKSKKTFADLINEGIKSYSEGSYGDAEKDFVAALSIEDTEEIPYYYLGLLNYARNDYSTAEYYYHAALQVSADKDIVYYALAVNALADNRYKDAEFYVESISKTGEITYKEKLEELTSRISEKKNSK